MENGTKLRLLYLYKHLLRYSDADHPISTPALIKFLQDTYGMYVNRTTLPNDFAMLEQAGFHFEIIKSKQNKYFFDGRLFDVPELKLLIDAVSTAKFIPEKKSKELIEKLKTLTSVYKADKLSRHLTAADRVNSEDKKVLEIVDQINNALNKGCKIAFQYNDYNIRKRKVLRNKGELYTVSPYELTWDGNYYYVIGYCDNSASIESFRLDRIARTLTVMDRDEVVPAPEDFSLADYTQKEFRMCGETDTVEVELLCEAHLMNEVIDRFGAKVPTRVIDKEHFMATVKVSPGPKFYRWVFGWDGDMQIVGPQEVIAEYRNMLVKALDDY